VFFPYLDNHGIKHIIHMGDFMDRRKFVNFQTLHEVRNKFIKALSDRGIVMDLILGNHDVYYKNTIEINSPNELFYDHKNIIVHDKPIIMMLGKTAVGYVPWIAKGNQEECFDFMKTAPVKILFGHFEISGYEAVRGVEHHEGMDASMFSGYDAIYSGHFHCKQSKGNIHYLGTQYQMTFSDLNEVKGFHIFDTETLGMEFIENPYQMFHQLPYDDLAQDYTIYNCKDFKDTFVKIVIKNKTKPIMYDNLIDRLNMTPVHGITVVDASEKTKNAANVQVDMSKDTLSLICDEIDTMENVIDPSRLKGLIREIYAESLQG
jgi:DNA repair exonuclease SbcCD nuclease subunit